MNHPRRAKSTPQMSSPSPEESYSVPGVPPAGATTVYYDPDPITGCGVTRITRFPGRPPSTHRESADPHAPSAASRINPHQRHLIGPTRPTGVGLIRSASNPTPIAPSPEAEDPNMYYHPMLDEWRPFPTRVEDEEEEEEEEQEEAVDAHVRKRTRVKEMGRKLVHKARDLGREKEPRMVAKEDISLPVPGSKRSAFEPIVEAMQDLV